MTDKSREVKELFEHTDLYLTYDYNLQIRKETVQTFTAGKNYQSVLDMPCGTGAISLPLLHRCEKLTLVDISSNMVKMASGQIPATEKHKVETINGDFFKIDLPKQNFDLVICLGLLAHVNSPIELLKKLSAHVAPGGTLIIQNTNSSHFYSYLIRFYLFLKGFIRKQPYKLNKVKASLVEGVLKNEGFTMVKSFRYNQSFLGLSNLFSNQKKYQLTRNFFGTAEQNKHAAWGSDYTYLFIKK